MKNKNDIFVLLLLAVVAFLFYREISRGFKNMFGSIGIGSTTTDDARETQIEKVADKVSDYFDPLWWQNKPGAKLLTVATAQSICKDIYNGIGYVYDTPEQIISAFNRAGYKTQISWLAYQFDKLYKKDLYSYLNSKLDTDAQRSAWLQILTRIKSLPAGF